jgi:hypothetical protein
MTEFHADFKHDEMLGVVERWCLNFVQSERVLNVK